MSKYIQYYMIKERVKVFILKTNDVIITVMLPLLEAPEQLLHVIVKCMVINVV